MNIDRTATVAAGAGTTVIKQPITRINGIGQAEAVSDGSGQLRRVLCSSAGTGTGFATFYDNTTGSGTIIGQVAANAAAGTFAVFDMPFTNGLTVVSPANAPAMTVSFV